MILLIALAIIFLVGLIWKINSGRWDVGGEVTMFISGIVLALAVLVIPIQRMGVLSHIERFHSISQTAQQARSSGDGLEGAAFRMEISDANKWLASAKYWRGTTFWIYWPDEIDDLEPIS